MSTGKPSKPGLLTTWTPQDIETDGTDDHCKGWKQLKLMFEGEDRQALQSLTANSTIMEVSTDTLTCPRCYQDTY